MSRHSESRSKAKARREANAAARWEETMRIHRVMWGRTETPPAQPETQTTTGNAPAQPQTQLVQPADEG